MFGIGFSEILVIAIVAVVFVGPKRLPEVMKQLGRFFVHARRMSNEVRSTFETVVNQAEQEIHLENLKKIRDLTAGTLINPLLEERPQGVRVPHPDDFQHHPTEASVAAHPAPAAAVETPSHIDKPDFDNHGKV